MRTKVLASVVVASGLAGIALWVALPPSKPGGVSSPLSLDSDRTQAKAPRVQRTDQVTTQDNDAGKRDKAEDQAATSSTLRARVLIEDLLSRHGALSLGVSEIKKAQRSLAPSNIANIEEDILYNPGRVKLSKDERKLLEGILSEAKTKVERLVREIGKYEKEEGFRAMDQGRLEPLPKGWKKKDMEQVLEPLKPGQSARIMFRGDTIGLVRINPSDSPEIASLHSESWSVLQSLEANVIHYFARIAQDR